MATYYVSTNGNDTTGDGSLATPWATIDHAQSQLGSDGAHEIWVAPGDYFGSAIQMDYEGSDADNVIAIHGDPNLTKSWVTSEIPGFVHITKCNSSHVPQTGTLWDFNSKQYIYLYDLYLDGVVGTTAADNILLGTSWRDGQRCIRCNIVGGGQYISEYIDYEYCFINAVEGLSGGTCKNCVVIIPYRSSATPVFDDCFILGGTSPIYSGTGRNCTIINPYNTMMAYSSGTVASANLIIGSFRAFSASSGNNDDVKSNIVFSCYDISADDTTDFSTTGSRYNRQCYYRTTSSNPPDQGHNMLFPEPMTIIRGVAQAFKITEFHDYDIDDSVATSEAKDIEGRTRDMRPDSETDSVICPGAMEFPDVVHQAADKIRIRKKGEEVFYIPVEAGVNVTATVTIAVTQPSAGDLPQLELLEPDDDGGWTQLDIDSATNAADTSLTVTGSPTSVDKVCILKLITRDTDAGAYTDFSDITIS